MASLDVDRRTRQKICHEPSTSPTTTNTATSNVKDGCSNGSTSARKSTTTVDHPDSQSQASSSGGGGGDTSNQPILPAFRTASRDSTASAAATSTSTSTSTQSAPEDHVDSQEPPVEKSIRDESSPAGSGIRGGDHQTDRSGSVDLLSTISSESAEYDFRLDGCHWVNEEAGSGSDSLMKGWSAASSHSEEDEALQGRVLTCSDWDDLLHSTENGASGGCPDAGAARTNHAFGCVYGRGSSEGFRSTGEISVTLSHMVRGSAGIFLKIIINLINKIV